MRKKIVVSQYDEILEDLGREGFETVKNNQSALGISFCSSALEQIPEHYAVCFSVSDQPWLTRETIRGLVTAFRKNTREWSVHPGKVWMEIRSSLHRNTGKNCLH
ncbi:MAG: NTP transferase domain-containing protein [Clostridium sp.]